MLVIVLELSESWASSDSELTQSFPFFCYYSQRKGEYVLLCLSCMVKVQVHVHSSKCLIQTSLIFIKSICAGIRNTIATSALKQMPEGTITALQFSYHKTHVKDYDKYNCCLLSRSVMPHNCHSCSQQSVESEEGSSDRWSDSLSPRSACKWTFLYTQHCLWWWPRWFLLHMY